MWLRIKPIILSFILGGLLAGCFSVWGLTYTATDVKCKVWLAILSGPGFATARGSLGNIPVVAIGWLGIPLIAAHLIRPSKTMAWVAVVGIVIWLLSGWIAAIYYLSP
jgi:hypothetical protein